MEAGRRKVLRSLCRNALRICPLCGIGTLSEQGGFIRCSACKAKYSVDIRLVLVTGPQNPAGLIKIDTVQ